MGATTPVVVDDGISDCVSDGAEEEQAEEQADELRIEVAALKKELTEARAAVRISQEAVLMATRKLAEAQAAAEEARTEAEAERDSLLAEIETLKRGRDEAVAAAAAAAVPAPQQSTVAAVGSREVAEALLGPAALATQLAEELGALQRRLADKDMEEEGAALAVEGAAGTQGSSSKLAARVAVLLTVMRRELAGQLASDAGPVAQAETPQAPASVAATFMPAQVGSETAVEVAEAPAPVAAAVARGVVDEGGFAETRAGIEAAGDIAEAAQRRVATQSANPALAPVVVGSNATGQAVPARTEVVVPPGHYWTLPPQRYEFMQERPLQVGPWEGVEQVGQADKAGKARVCHFYRLPGLVPKEEVDRVLEHVARSEAYVTDPDSVDHTPTFEYYPYQNGRWVDEAMRPLLEAAMEERVLPYIRERYACPDCAVADILVRRYLPGERRTHAVHFDGHAFVTAVLGLSDPDEYEGGLYVQPGADVASRTFFRIEPGDLVVHSFDLQHGVHVWKGIRYSLIFWVKDSSQAVREHTTPWYDELAERGDADALYALALNYSNGSSGKTLDIVKAIELYERSARVGHHFAQNNLGTLYKKAHKVMGLAGGLEKSVGWLRAAAEAGFGMAQKNLALAYAMGEGVERDEAEAAKWMRRSAEQLDVEAAHLLGEMCREGRGVPRDLGEAARWYRRSAKAGFPRAQYTLGILHLEGQGVVRDQEKAEAWFRYAAKQGVPEAKNNVAALAAQRGDVQEAANIWSDLAAGGEPNAQCNLGMCYMRGLGRDRDVQRAREWLGKAAAQGHRMAQHALVQL